MALCDCPVGPPIGPTLASTCGGGQFMLFMGLLEVFLRSQCDLEDPCGRPKVTFIISFFFKKFTKKIINFLFKLNYNRVEQYLKQIMILLLLVVGLVVR